MLAGALLRLELLLELMTAMPETLASSLAAVAARARRIPLILLLTPLRPLLLPQD